MQVENYEGKKVLRMEKKFFFFETLSPDINFHENFILPELSHLSSIDFSSKAVAKDPITNDHRRSLVRSSTRERINDQ